MNIIKLKDTIMPANLPQADFFNKHLKGKYAFWFHMRYIVSFDHATNDDYVIYEEDIDKLLCGDTSYLDLYTNDYLDYVDSVETDKVNNITHLKLINSYSPDDDITIDELKLFRTWLAKQLFHLSPNTTDFKILHILNYYTNDLYDNTVKILSDFGQTDVKYSPITTSTCGCGNSDVSSLYNTSLSVCDPLSVYRKNVYNKMVELFSDVTYWEQWPTAFIEEFKKYIDNIIKCNFPLSATDWYKDFVDCGCSNKSDQDKYIEILKKLSTSLGYIKDKQVVGHKNYINDALYDWSTQLYEKMQW